MRGAALIAPALTAVALWSGGCGSLDPAEGEPDRPPESVSERGRERAASSKARPRPPRCPPGSLNCRRAGGRVVYVERVDPDGEGDAHLVLASRAAITAPGLTVVDLEPGVRPARLPRPGDWVGAAGPVYRGSHGQRQIEATRIRVRPAGRPARRGGR